MLGLWYFEKRDEMLIAIVHKIDSILPGLFIEFRCMQDFFWKRAAQILHKGKFGGFRHLACKSF